METNIKVLGSGCKSCHQLFESAKIAAQGLDADVEFITDMQKIVQYGAMSMPALVVNEKLVSAGRILKPAQIREMIEKN